MIVFFIQPSDGSKPNAVQIELNPRTNSKTIILSILANPKQSTQHEKTDRQLLQNCIGK